MFRSRSANGFLFLKTRLLAAVTVLCLLVSAFSPAAAMAADPVPVQGAGGKAAVSDIAGHWAERQIGEWIEAGRIQGFPDGTFRPDRTITRAEFAALVNRIFGFTEAAPDWRASDLAPSDWAFRDIAAAAQAGYLKGYADGRFGAKQPVSRQEAAVVVARLLASELTPDAEAADAFTDAGQMAAWSKEAIGTAAAGKLMEGYVDGSFKPERGVTRAETVAILERILSGIGLSYNKAGTFGPFEGAVTVKGNVAIRVPGVTLRNMIIEGDLLVGDGVGEGDVSLSGVTVKGKTTLNGGGENSVHVQNAILGEVHVDKKTGTLRIVLEGSSQIALLILQSSSVVESAENASSGAGIGLIRLDRKLAAGAKIRLAGSFKEVEIDAPGIELQLSGGVIQKLTNTDQAPGTRIALDKDARIVALLLNEVVRMQGEGDIDKVIYGSNGNGSTFERRPHAEEGKATHAPETGTQTASPTPTPTNSPTSTPTDSPTTTPTMSPTSTPTDSPTTTPTMSPTPTPTATVSPDPEPSVTPTLVDAGTDNADIVFSPLADEMERLAARELRDTLRMISGAELPIYEGQIDGDSVSVELLEDRLDLKENGTYHTAISVMNNSAESAALTFRRTDDGPIAASFEPILVLAPQERRNVPVAVQVTNAAEDGVHLVTIQADIDGLPVATMNLSVSLNRNLLLNSSFETVSASGWNVSSGALDKTAAHSGTQSMRLEFSAPYATLRTDQQLKLQAGHEYALSAWVKGSQPSGQKVIAQFAELSSDWSKSNGMPQYTFDVTDTWTRIEIKYTPVLSTQLDFAWAYFHIVAGTDRVWIDDVSLRATGVTSDPDPQPEPANLIGNPGFESESPGGELPTDWNVPSGALDKDVKRSGTNALRIDLPAAGWTAVRTDPIFGMQIGEEYVLKAWVKGSAPTGQRVLASFMEKNNADWADLVPPTEMVSHDVSDGWTQVEWTFTPQAVSGSNFVLAYLYIVSDTPALWVDDVTLTIADKGTSRTRSDSSLSLTEEQAAPAAQLTSGAETEERYQIIVGTPDSYPALAALFPADIADLHGTDGFAIRQTGNRIYILGTEPKGALNGVYDFLEKNTGILWTRASDTGTVYEPQQTVRAEHVNYSEKSPFLLRGWHLTGLGANGEYHSDPATELMMARNKLNAKLAEFENLPLWAGQDSIGIKPFNIGHNLGYWLPNALFFNTHPEYFNTDANGNPIPESQQTQINFYHPDVPGVIAERVAAFLDENPIEYVGVGINDTHYYEQAGYSDQPFVTEDGVTIQPNEADYKSTVFYTFLNKIARQVKVTHPEAKIVTFAYFFTEVPPRIALEDNIVIVLAPISGDERLPMKTDDPDSLNYAYVLKLQGWLAKTNQIVMYNYYGSFLSDKYERPIAEKVQADMRYYRELGLTGVIPEGIVDANGPNWAINALQFWLFEKLMWNPDADIEQLKTEYIAKVYGDASVPMRTYYDLIEQGWNQYDDPIAYNTSASTYIGKYVIEAGIADEAQQALDQAWALADEKVRARIAPIKTTFEKMVEEVGGRPQLEAHALRTTASEQDIMNATDFSQGPWADAVPVTEFLKINTGDPVPVQTKVRLLWDDNNLYVGYENFDNDVSKIVSSAVAPGEWWTSGADDDNETFITGDASAQNYYVFFNNPAGLKLEYSGPVQNSGYSAPWQARANVGADRWISIQAIPFASIGVDPSATKTLSGYFFRSYHGQEGFFGWGGGTVWSASDFYPIRLEENA
ncbi:DUF4838 domain-containing protein [Cohnella sp. GCM10012308]|uniref:DUF4838 domain-containing protein n=1 Tax=Cohnella sp. GCM10012308 TaxID=3317329 RepID=UPI00361A5D19